mmetsp:Transcript_6051/g.9259  ORF Transcript_6051/g.9259 Transcript_6051/m.9259 type:complete len:81 (+) Transcript_6051:1222-1464(+)
MRMQLRKTRSVSTTRCKYIWQKKAADEPPPPPQPVAAPAAQQNYMQQHEVYDNTSAAMPHHYSDPAYSTPGYDPNYQYHG